jgi:8-oxo-dGTP pyrophosphatase MutT (NUDIX family)
MCGYGGRARTPQLTRSTRRFTAHPAQESANPRASPGGHIEAGEDPVQALHHEVREETGLDVEILADERFRHPSVGVVAPPFTILIINDMPDPATGPHTHIDLVYLQG